MDWLIPAAVIIGYLSLGLELCFLHVPSVASTRSLFFDVNQFSHSGENKFAWIFAVPKFTKTLILLIPLLGVYLVFLIPLLIIANFSVVANPILFHPSAPIQILGIVLIILGRLITLQATLTLHRNADNQHSSFQLQTDGLFAKSRNPIQVGMYIFFCGIVCCMPSIWLCVGILYYTLYMHVKIMMEESFLTNMFGHDYQQYINRTRRYL